MSFFNNGINISNSGIEDNANRSSTNSVFGEKVIGVRVPSISTQYQYGLDTKNTVTNTLNGGTSSIINSMLTLSTNTNINGKAIVQSKKALRYVAGHEAYTFFTAIFTEGVGSSYQRIGLFDEQNGFFLGYEGNVFGATRRRNGIDVFIPQSDFNMDKLDGTGSSRFILDKTKGNVYAIKFGYLGFADIFYEIMLPNGSWITFHKVEYPNSAIETHIANAYLPVRGEVANLGNNTNMVIKGGSITAGIVDGSGKSPSSREFTKDSPNIVVSAGNSLIIAFKNKPTFNGIKNYIPSNLLLISSAIDGNKNITLNLHKNPTITNTPNWTDVDANNSTIAFSTDAILNYSQLGELFLSLKLAKSDSFFEIVESLNLLLYPNEIAVLTVNVPSGGTGISVDTGIRWSELF